MTINDVFDYYNRIENEKQKHEKMVHKLRENLVVDPDGLRDLKQKDPGLYYAVINKPVPAKPLTKADFKE